jgi:predicted kinase
MVQLVILIGLQGSGKSTFYRQRFAATHAYVSRDQLGKNRNPIRRQRELIDSTLAAGGNVLVDNTNVRVADRAALVKQAKGHRAQVVGYCFEPELKQSLARNRQRDPPQRVPDVAIFATLKRFESPSLTEGFDELFSVRVTGENDFFVTPFGGPEGNRRA